MYKIGDKFISKYFSNFEIIAINEHYKDSVIVTYNEKGQYSAKPMKEFASFLKERNYEQAVGQMSMGTTL